MSIRVKARADRLHLKLESHELRKIVDRIIEEVTGKPCDEGVDDLSDEEFVKIVTEAHKRYSRKKPPRKELKAYA